uniref:G_PROTEIN_RECEP_F1_2 domain-containing protein n=1 Tax=Meloidogyne incognita TaxID=6306 RepID=A0A914MXE5_MELIC
MSNITTDPAYAAFKDAGFCVPLVLLIFCKASVCLLGIILNGDLVYITWKTKTLRGACNLQIALNAFSICIQQSSSFVTLAVVVSGTNFIPLRYCGIIQISVSTLDLTFIILIINIIILKKFKAIPLFCTIFTNGIAFSIGVDRLLSVAFPIWYMIHDKKNYLTIIIIFCCLYALIVPICGINISLSNPEIPVMCTVIDPMQKDATWVVIMLLSVNLSSVFCYISVWIILMFKGSMKKTQLNVFKSLSVILLMEICGWISNYSIRLIIGAANLHTLNSWYIINITTIMPYIAMSLSPVSLYIFSTEYSRAFLKQFPFISPSNFNSSTTAVVPFGENSTVLFKKTTK